MSDMIDRDAAAAICGKHSYSNNQYVSMRMIDAAKEIRALPAVEVGVKPLDWENFDAWTYWARCPVGTYHVEERNGIWKTTLDKNRGLELVYEYTTDGLTPDDFQAAKAAAQADYDARIRSALTVTPDPDPAKVQALVDVVGLMGRFFEEVMPKLNVANSFLDANAFDVWNRASIATDAALAAWKDGK